MNLIKKDGDTLTLLKYVGFLAFLTVKYMKVSHSIMWGFFFLLKKVNKLGD